MLYLNPKDHDLANVVNRVGDCDKIANHCKKRNLAVQAGSYYGIYPERLAKLFDKVITFEADALNFGKWEKPSGNITRYQAILGSNPGTAGIMRKPHHCAQSYVVEDGDITIMTIDGLDLPECDLIYLDIEGYELKALEGAAETIKKFKPIIAVEQKRLSDRLGHGRQDDMLIFLGANGYKYVTKYNLDNVYAPI